MASINRNLFKLYDLIQNGDACQVRRFLSDCPIEVNSIVPCKGIGILHLSVGIDPLVKSKECTEILLKYGADPNLSTEDGVTPLHIAAIWGRVENLKLLIGCGGDPLRRDFDGHSAFDYAAREQQWEVFDYLHNVEDQIDDSIGHKCAYRLKLDKILVKTDQMVAEYEQIANEQPCQNTSWRKSQMVREWCDKTTFTMNKLYPTILGETFIIDNETFPSYESRIINRKTAEATAEIVESSDSSGTKASYKTCLTQKITPQDIKISGIAPLESTCHETHDNTNCNSGSKEQRQRFSVFENFSLPGSPNSIVHKNYHTKSSLKKSVTKSDSQSSNELCKDRKELFLEDHISLITDDDSIKCSFDRALEEAQNRTNERISNNFDEMTDIKASNTRRSSASSGVSSNFSAGSIAVANVEEEYKYHDKDEDVVLIEKRLLLSTVVVPVEDPPDLSNVDQTIVSIASSLPSSIEYDNNTLRTELIKLGFKPGPIDAITRTLYLKKLKKLKKNPIVVQGQQGKTYSIELEKSLRNPKWMSDLTLYAELEARSRADFANPNRKWREGTAKTSFTYLLLDPRLTDNLPVRATKQTQHENWVAFVNSIFYVGKGKRSRPYSHLYQALTLWKKDFTTSKDKKVHHILDIWSNKVGVVCLHIFQNVIPAEAYTYEAAMIDVLGLINLKNLKSGNYYGSTASWPLKERRMLGLYLLYKAMMIFLSEGERQLRPDDID